MTTGTISTKPITGHEFCWCEVATRDADTCGDFYCELLGWTRHKQDMEGHPYTMFRLGDVNVGGMMTMDDSWPAEVPPHWLSYVAVTDIDALATRATELGASLCVPPTDIPVGRFCVITDPTGGTFPLFQGGDGQNPTGDRTFGWWELASNDTAKSIEFYSELLGWEAREESMVEHMQYWCFYAGENVVAAVHALPEHWGEGHPSCWTPSVQCEDIDEVTARVESLGGHVYMQPEDVSSCVRYSAIQDPTGAVITLYTYIGDPSGCCSDGSCNT